MLIDYLQLILRGLTTFGLCWLPNNLRVDFGILHRTYKAVHGLAPAFIADPTGPDRFSRVLHSSDPGLLVTPNVQISVPYLDPAAFSQRSVYPLRLSSLPRPFSPFSAHICPGGRSAWPSTLSLVLLEVSVC